ncbi:MAG: type I DNA topoisomerase [Mangrovibacterium sp.]
MQENLVIVESPAKAKTIEKFLGKNFLVTSSMGHIRDLEKKDGIDVENGFAPKYEVSPDKKKIVTELCKQAKTAKLVWIASDEDREGEAIAWHLKEVLKLKPEQTRRIVFHEITKDAILKAVENPRDIDENLVNAQQARRILDRLVGFEVSPVLWRKVKPSLSAGRVQSVAVRLIVEREREIIAFESTSAYRVVANFLVPDASGNTVELKAELNKRFDTKAKAQAFLEKCVGADFNIESIQKKPAKRTPAAPFTTSTLQQEASRKLGFSVSRTMSVAQRLYESGQITYMRTDSVNLSDLAINAAKKTIIANHGEKYYKYRQYKTKAKGAQEAHEAIRPTYLENDSIDGSPEEKRLYDLIWKRTIASQMSDAQLERTTISVTSPDASAKFQATGEQIKFDGFLHVYLESTDDEDSEETKDLLPAVSEGQALRVQQIDATERFTQKPPRYTEASLVKKLEEQGIGRPSTYAPTITTIQNRGYVVKEDRDGTPRNFTKLLLIDTAIEEQNLVENTGVERAKLFPTDIGMVVNDFLIKHFTQIMDYGFTANVEEEFDEIAEGKQVWNDVLARFYKPFHAHVEDAMENSERETGERQLGDDPSTGKPVSVRIGRYGPFAQLGKTPENDEDEKPQFASLRTGQILETITLEEALDLFKLPRDLGEYEDKKVVVAIGRFGPYVRHDGKFVSLKKDVDDPMEIQLPRAVELIEEKREKDRKALLKTFEEDADLRIIEGRWGPYISYQKNNYKIVKGTDLDTLGYAECMKIINSTPTKATAKGKTTRTKKK